MAYLAVDSYFGFNQTEYIFDRLPTGGNREWFVPDDSDGGNMVELPRGSIKRLIGHSLTWEDEPFYFTEVVTNE
jgi:hypothetical protein